MGFKGEFGRVNGASRFHYLIPFMSHSIRFDSRGMRDVMKVTTYDDGFSTVNDMIHLLFFIFLLA